MALAYIHRHARGTSIGPISAAKDSRLVSLAWSLAWCLVLLGARRCRLSSTASRWHTRKVPANASILVPVSPPLTAPFIIMCIYLRSPRKAGLERKGSNTGLARMLARMVTTRSLAPNRRRTRKLPRGARRRRPAIGRDGACRQSQRPSGQAARSGGRLWTLA